MHIYKNNMISTQAIVLTICNLIILVALIISMFIIKRTNDNEQKVGAIMKNMSALLGFIIIMGLQIYSLNCMVYGDCHLWSWILVGFGILGTLSYLGVFAYIAYTLKKQQGLPTDK